MATESRERGAKMMMIGALALKPVEPFLLQHSLLSVHPASYESRLKAPTCPQNALPRGRRRSRQEGLSCSAPAVARHSKAHGAQWETGSSAWAGAMDAAARSDWATSFDLFKASLTQARRPGVPDCNRYLRILGDKGKLQDAVKAYEAMLAAGLEPSLITFSTLISRAGAWQNVGMAERFYKEMQRHGIKPDVQAMNSLINAFAKAGKLQNALGVFEEMKEMKVAPSIITFNSVLDACVRAGDPERAMEVLEWIRQWGLQPNERTYSIIIHLNAKRGRVEAAFSVLRSMEAEGIQPNEVTYSALINACGRAGELDRAFKTLEEMSLKGFEPNVVVWTTLIDACGKAKELQMSFSLFKEMVARGVAPNGVTCSALLDACLKEGELDIAFSVLQHMHDTGLAPTQVTYTSILSECARQGRADHAARVLEQMRTKAKDAEASSVSMDMGLEQDLLKLFGQAQRVDTAFKVLENMAARREMPDDASWGSLFDAVETAKDFDKAVNLLEDMRTKGEPLPINEVTYSALLGACGRVKTLMRAFTLLKGMQGAGAAPTEQTYLALLEVCRDIHDGQAAVNVFEMMKDSGVQPGVRTYTTLLKALSDDNVRQTAAIQGGKAPASKLVSDEDILGASSQQAPLVKQSDDEKYSQDNLMRVFLLFREMRSNGITPDRPAYNALINSCAKSRDLDRALKVVEEMVVEDGLQPDVITYTSLIKAAANASPPNVEKAEEIFQAMQQRTNHFMTYCQPTEVTYAHVMRANLYAKNYARVGQIWNLMIQAGVQPDIRTSRVMLMCCRHTDNIDRAFRVYQVMMDNKIRLDNKALHALVSLCKAQGLEATATQILKNRSKASYKPVQAPNRLAIPQPEL